jgi:NitT/TauT family transport system ATP-binding protein
MRNDLSYQQVCKSFAGKSGGSDTVAVEGFSFSVRESEFLVIVGPSGCGKSTLLTMTGALTPPTSGRILLGGEDIRKPGPDKAIVFQGLSLFPWKTVRENIDFGLRINRIDRKERDDLVAYYIRLTGLQGFENHFPKQLSGGMQQRVAIARSLVMRPRVLLMDEPFAALDAQNRTLMQEELVRLWESQKPTVLFITHSVEEAVYLADRIIVMTRRPGRIKDVIDVGAVAGDPHWRGTPLDRVMAEPRFQELRHAVWDQIRTEITSH